jgi:hypothetical protein
MHPSRQEEIVPLIFSCQPNWIPRSQRSNQNIESHSAGLSFEASALRLCDEPNATLLGLNATCEKHPIPPTPCADQGLASITCFPGKIFIEITRFRRPSGIGGRG